MGGEASPLSIARGGPKKAEGCWRVGLRCSPCRHEGAIMSRYLITGATGFLGGHLAEACVRRGDTVRALVRDGTDASALEKLGVEVVRGDLRELPGDVLDGVEVVFHCAAKVGDWGPAEEYRAVNVEGLRALLEASRGRPLKRFIHF